MDQHLILTHFGNFNMEKNMEKNMEDIKTKEFIIVYYKKLLESSVNREDYETAAKYKRWIDNLEKSGEK